jgi:hypothetical protein
MIIASANCMGLSRHRISDKARRKEAFEQLDTIQILVNTAGTGSRVGSCPDWDNVSFFSHI